MMEEKRPKKYRNDPCGYLKTDDGFSCQLCLFSCQKSNTMQQHCMSHFPAQHQCVECGDCFYMKGVLLNHYKVECESCGKKIRLGSISSHNCLKR